MNDQMLPIIFIVLIAIIIILLIIIVSIALIFLRLPKRGGINSDDLKAGGNITIQQTIYHTDRYHVLIYMAIVFSVAIIGLFDSVIEEAVKIVFDSQLNITFLIVLIGGMIFGLIVNSGLNSWREARFHQSAKQAQAGVISANSAEEKRHQEIVRLQMNIEYHTQKIENLDRHTKIWRRYTASNRAFHASEIKQDIERLRQLGVHDRPRVNIAENRKIGLVGHLVDVFGILSMFLILLTIGTFSSYISVETGLTARIIQLSLPETKSENPIGYKPTPTPTTIPRQTGAAIIIAGRDQENDNLQENIHNVTDRVYRLFHEGAGYPHSHIHYMATNAYMNSNSANIQIDAEATIENLQDIILNQVLNQVNDQQPLTIYMMSHGLGAGFYLDEVNGERLYATTLDSWLDELESLRPGLQINIIIDGCYAGSFVENPDATVAGENRVVIGSSSANELAWASFKGALFSDYFLLGLQQKRNLKDAFEVAQAAVNAGFPKQSAWIEGDGDSQTNEIEDSNVADTRILVSHDFGELYPIADSTILSDKTLTSTVLSEQIGAVIIVAGRHSADDILQENIHNVTDRVYRLFHEGARYPHSHIHYMATSAYINDGSDNIQIDAKATVENLQNMILTDVLDQVGNGQPLTIYMMSHGREGVFYLDEVHGERIEPASLDSWLDELENLRPELEINLIIDTSDAGSFITNPNETIAGQNRVVIGSSSATDIARASFGSSNFSDYFLLGLQQRRSLKDAFKSAQAAANAGSIRQSAWIDDDGNSQPNEVKDGDVAATRFLLPYR